MSYLAFVAWGTTLVEMLPFVAGVVAGILLRRRGGTTALLITLGFGLGLLSRVLHLVVVGIQYALIGSDDYFSIANAFGYVGLVVPRFAELAGFVLIIVGLLRLVRRRTAADAGVTR